MGLSVSLRQLGYYLIDEVERTALVQTGEPGQAWLRIIELDLAFAPAEGTSPATIVVGEVPISPDEARRRLTTLQGRVSLDLPDLQKRKANELGRFLLRLQLVDPHARALSPQE